MSTYTSEVDANALFTALTADDTATLPTIDFNDPSFNIPSTASVDWYKHIDRLVNSDITNSAEDGDGTFDSLLKGYAAQLRTEYQAGRITGGEYTKAFIAAGQNAMATAIQFLLGRDQAYWQAVNAQVAAITAQVQLATAKLQYAQAQVQVSNIKAEYALNKLKLATEDAQYGGAKYNIDNILPQQLALSTQQVAQSVAQVSLINEQKALVTEQIESTRAQTLDTRTDGVTPISGVLGKQKSLYSQQVTSYQRDSENKAVKIFTDAWITMKTIDDGLLPPTNFSNANLDTMLGTFRTNNGF